MQKALKILGWVVGGVVSAAIVLLILALILVSSCAPTFIQKQITQKTGFPVRAERFLIDPLGGRVELKNFQIDNPAEFGGESFIKLPTFVVQVDIGSLAGKTIHLRELTLNLENVRIVTNAQGLNNAQVFSDRLKAATQKPSEADTATANKEEPKKVSIDKLHLQVGSVIIVNATRTPARTTTMNLGFDFQRKNVTDMMALQQEIAASAISQALSKGIRLNALTDLTGGIFEGAGSAAAATGKALKSGSEEAAKAAEKIEKAAEGIKSLRELFKK